MSVNTPPDATNLGIATVYQDLALCDNLTAAIEGQQVLIEPNSPSPGVLVAFIEVQGAPVELLQIDHERRPDL